MAGRILYVEDEKFLGRTLKGMLEKAGFEVVLAEDGEAGIVQAVSGNFDLILLDLLLPKLDGFEVLRRLKEAGVAAKSPIFILSNLNGAEDQKKAIELGARGYFVKAMIDPRDLVAGIEKSLSSASQ